ncbi:MAG: hypothetical protein ACKVW3_00105 [Phycisphaerales bacterium]
MKNLYLWISAVSGAISLPCAAQLETVDLWWSMIEIGTANQQPVSNPNNIIEPGESARFNLNISFSPGVGSTTTYTPPPGPGTGIIAGFFNGVVDLILSSPQPGVWTPTQSLPGWEAGGSSIMGPQGDMTVAVGQALPPLGSVPNPANPILGIRSMTWTPASYQPISFGYVSDFQEGYVALFVEYARDPSGNPLFIGKQVDGGFNTGTVQVAPAPASALVLAAGGFIASLRRRRA